MDSYQLVQLVNGAWSVRSLAHHETFHPVVGPVAEAQALYLHQLNLLDRLRAHTGDFVIWDVGLGAAANPLTLLRASGQLPTPIRILSFDQTVDPLRFALAHADRLGYFQGYQAPVRALLEQGTATFANGAHPVQWTLHLGDFPGLLSRPEAEAWPKPHAILFDAFSPARNPEMWTLPLFDRLYRLLDPARPCALPTYSRSTMLRATLLLAGFQVGHGRATGEKEQTTIAANRPELIAEPLGADWLRRARRSTSAEPLREPRYRQAPLSAETWTALQNHPQFRR